MSDKILIDLIKKLIIENDNIINVRGGRGYGVGHPYPNKLPKPVLGKSEFEKEKKDKKEKSKKVKISKAFKRKKK